MDSAEFYITPEMRDQFKKKLKQWVAENPDEYDIFYFARLIRRRLRQDWDLYYCIEGLAGSGKSCLSIIVGLLVDDSFQLKKNISYIPQGDELKEQFMSLKRYGYLQVDEAIRAMSRYKWQSKQQQQVMEMAATERFRNQCIAFLVPSFHSLAKSLRERRLDIRVWISARGHASVYHRLVDKDSEDVWQVKNTLDMKNKEWAKLKYTGKSLHTITPEQRLNLERKTPNYAYEFKFPDLKVLAPEIFQAYEAMKVASRERDIEEANKVEEKKGEYISPTDQKRIASRNRFIVHLIETQKISFNKAAKIGGIGATTVAEVWEAYQRSKGVDVKPTELGFQANTHASEERVLSNQEEVASDAHTQE